MNRFVQSILIVMLTAVVGPCLAASPGDNPITQTKEGVYQNAELPKKSVQLFPLKDVRLLESPFSEAVNIF